MILPTLWNLQRLPNIELDLFRDHFRPGARQSLEEWFTGSYHKYDTFFGNDLSDYDIVFLTTGDRASAALFDSKVTQLYPHLKVVAIAHAVQRYTPAKFAASKDKRTRAAPVATSDLANIQAMMRDNRWSFLCLSPHVTSSLSRVLSIGTMKNNTHALSFQTFIPVSQFFCFRRRLRSAHA